ncbi:solute carrier family 22 member 4-like [Trematomus bernacchii]|uniref:solute carrier family 22 member 4-like n=1 Tax=Trematomus bernacchii TaxID=40690 RepID=UPI00146CD128|nr:solute carrier family 22 member 4-like [Trematomus bernacchii]XP_033984781.1 solute carrier family 22 member 4-like [Trematomus bernacchii]
MQDYEESVSFLGTWGPFQKRVFLLLCLTSIPGGYHLLSVVFLLATPSHHCHIPAHSNLSEDWILASIPVQVAGGRPERSSCSRYELDLVQNLSAVGGKPALNWINQSSAEVLMSSLKREGCKDGWTYSTEHYKSTVVSEFNLVCSDQWKQPLTSLFYFLGGLFGCFISGQISDRFGRKPVLFGAIFVLSLFSSAVAFVPSWPVFIVLFFMLGMGQITSFIAAFVLGSELLMGSTRVIFCSLCLPCVYVIATLLLPVTAYLVSSWRHLSLTMAVPGLVCLPFWWLIPESPRWLVSHGRFQEAELLLRSAALHNRVEAPYVIFIPANVEKETSEKVESTSILDLLKTANIRNVTLMLWIIWFSLNVSFFGISFNMSSLYGNPFLNYFLLTAVELPAYTASWLVVRTLPRRLSCISFTLLGALALLLIQITLDSNPAITLTLVLLGKFGILAGIAVLYMFTSELSPTVIRNTAMSSSAMFSRVGSSVSPYLLQLAVFNQFLPWIIVGCLSLLSVLVCFFLPETFRQPLIDTIEQMPPVQRFRWPWASTPPPEDDGKLAKDQITAPEIICTSHL